MQTRFLTYTKNLKISLLLVSYFLTLGGCSIANNNPGSRETNVYDFNKKLKVRCTVDSKFKVYEIGDTPCWKIELEVNNNEKIIIHFKVINENSEDLYERGYQELLRIKDGKVVERMKLRRDDDAYWSEVPFVRIRKQKYLADLDNDGFLEFAVFPFSSGSAIWGTVRIFSLKSKIEFWGEGRYQFEGDSYVQLGCMSCSKFNPKECRKCY
ncbi:MAG: hypothetical protein ACPGJV_10930 [Bacteriovoracaceae bacterium]